VVEAELARGGWTVYDAMVLSIDEVERRSPSTFGPVENQTLYEQDRAAVRQRAAEAQAKVAAIERELLIGIAWIHGERVEPESSLPERLITHLLNFPKGAPPAPPRPRGTEGAEFLAADPESRG
jgi:hypothetical protein